jgi:hypothetical protein
MAALGGTEGDGVEVAVVSGVAEDWAVRQPVRAKRRRAAGRSRRTEQERVIFTES